jgi:hypothetical protein
MSSKYNCSDMEMSSLTYIPGFSVKFFFQPIYRFGLIWFKGFRGEDLNVKVYDV